MMRDGTSHSSATDNNRAVFGCDFEPFPNKQQNSKQQDLACQYVRDLLVIQVKTM